MKDRDKILLMKTKTRSQSSDDVRKKRAESPVHQWQTKHRYRNEDDPYFSLMTGTVVTQRLRSCKEVGELVV